MRSELLNNIFFKISVALLFLFAVAISIKELNEPDIFWQLATGEWIIDHKSIPDKDPFSYTFADTTWINIKWGYEVIIALISKTLSIEFIPLFQIVFLGLLVFILLKLNRLFIPDDKRTMYNTLSALCILLIMANSSYRFNLRPELISYTFTMLYVWLINTYKYRKKILFILPLIQICWTNLHEAYALGIITIFIFTISDWIWWFIDKQNRKQQPVYLTVSLLLSVASTVINPYGLEMFLRPLEIFDQLSANKFTQELSSYSSPSYWKPQAYISILLICITVTGIALKFIKTPYPKRFFNFINIIGPGNIVMLLAMLFLAANAFRNIALFNLMLCPFLLLALMAWLELLPGRVKSIIPLATGILAVASGFTLYASVISNSFYRKMEINSHYGLNISSTANPVDAAEFLEKNKLTGKRFYTDYLSSSYMIYKLTPGYKSFIDLRDLDIYTDSFMRVNAEAISYYESYQRLDSFYRFDGAIVLNKQLLRLMDGLHKDSTYYLCYYDPLISVFLKKKHMHEIPKANKITLPQDRRSETLLTINKIFNPFYRYETLNQNSVTEEANYLSIRGNYENASALLRANHASPENYSVEEFLIEANYYYQRSSSFDSATRAGSLDSAIYFYNSAVLKDPGSFNACYGLGMSYFSKGNIEFAATNFIKACELNKEFVDAHLYAAECYKLLFEGDMQNKTYLKNYLAYGEKCDKLQPGNPHVIWNVGVAHYHSGNYGKAEKFLNEALQYQEYLTEEDINIATQYIKASRRK